MLLMKTKTGLGKKILRSVLSLLLLLLVVLAAVYIALNWDSLKGRLPNFFTKAFNISTEAETEIFKFEPYSDNEFAGLNDGLIVASGIETELFNSSGALIARVQRSIDRPVISTGALNAVVWSVGGRSLLMINTKGGITDITTEGVLISADVNDSGYLAYASGEKGYKGSVTVCDNRGTGVYRVYLGSGYPVDADISPSSTNVAVLTLTEDGSKVSIYGLDSDREKYSWVSPEELFIDIEYLTDNRICLISENSIRFLNGSCELIGSYEFTDEYLKNYSAGSGSSVSLVLGKYKTGNQGRLLTLDSAGNVTASLDINQEVYKISIGGKYLTAVYSDSAVIYNTDLVEIGRLEDTAGIKAAILRSDGSAIIISGYGAAIFNPKE